MKKGSPNTIYLKDYTPPPYLIDTVELCFRLHEEYAEVQATLAVRRNPAAGARAEPLRLDGEGLELLSLRLDGAPLPAERYRCDDAALTVLHLPERCTLETITRTRPQDNTALEGLYRSGGNFCTQCEAQGFRRITYFLDRPDVMAVYTTRIEAERARYPVLLSNGDRTEQGELEDGRHYAVWRDPHRKPCYLFALVAGQLALNEDTHVTTSGRRVRLCIYTEPHNADKCAHAMDSLKKAMRWDEQRFALEYDLDTYMIVAVDDFNMGAMENKGLNVFNSKYVLARPDTATDEDYEGIEGVIAHEYFHNWTGNRVTCRDWFQLSLKEGLTVFRDQEFSLDVFSPVKRIDDVRVLRTHQFAEDAGPMAHPVRPQSYIEINNFYTVTVYEKGSEVVRMYQTLLGRDGFRKGMDLYFQRHDGQAVTTDDFCAAMADANGADLTQFKRWYEQAGTPRLTAFGAWESETKRYRLRLAQSCPATPGQAQKLPLQIPVRMALMDAQGRDLPLRLMGEAKAAGTERVLELLAAEQEFVFEDLPCAPVPSLLRDFSAPVHLEDGADTATLAFRFAHDSDPFSRWDAGQRLAIALLAEQIADYRAHRPMKLPELFVEAFRKTLADDSLDPAFRAEALTLPGETYVAESFKRVDVEAIHAAREFMRAELASALEPQWQALYAKNEVGGVYRYHPLDAGRRRLRALALAYLASTGAKTHLDQCVVHFERADNMSDSLAALRALSDLPGAQREAVFAQFEQRWRAEPLVLDKWFALQASAALPDVLESVRRLMGHPGFSLRNPNRVRALLSAFAHGNPIGFHQASGEAYGFICEQVLMLDKANPQVAARLAKAFAHWRKYDAGRQVLMRAELARMQAAADISKDLFEVVSKTLA